MKPIIGVIYRSDVSKSGNKIDIVYKDILEAILSSGGVPVGVVGSKIEDYFDICSGFILQGGDDISDESLALIKKIVDKDIPLLGICLGMQEMGCFYDGVLEDIDNHKDSEMLHSIIIDKNSLLYKIVGSDKIMVNSRHRSSLVSSKLKVSSRSEDGVIESIENKDLFFFLGLQWHPENLYKENIYARKIFDYFVKICN